MFCEWNDGLKSFVADWEKKTINTESLTKKCDRRCNIIMLCYIFFTGNERKSVFCYHFHRWMSSVLFSSSLFRVNEWLSEIIKYKNISAAKKMLTIVIEIIFFSLFIVLDDLSLFSEWLIYLTHSFSHFLAQTEHFSRSFIANFHLKIQNQI